MQRSTVVVPFDHGREEGELHRSHSNGLSYGGAGEEEEHRRQHEEGKEHWVRMPRMSQDGTGGGTRELGQKKYAQSDLVRGKFYRKK